MNEINETKTVDVVSNLQPKFFINDEVMYTISPEHVFKVVASWELEGKLVYKIENVNGQWAEVEEALLYAL